MNRRSKLEALYTVYEQPMYRIAYAILHDRMQAEDAVSEAFLKIMQHLEQLDEPTNPCTKQYMIQVIRTTAINQYRKNSRENQYTQAINEETMQLADADDELSRRMKYTENRQEVEAMLQGLDESERALLQMRCVEELSFREIGERMSLSENTVRKRYERLRRSIRKQKEECTYEHKLYTF